MKIGSKEIYNTYQPKISQFEMIYEGVECPWRNNKQAARNVSHPIPHPNLFLCHSLPSWVQNEMVF